MAEERKTGKTDDLVEQMDVKEDSSEPSEDDQSEEEELNDNRIKELQQMVVILRENRKSLTNSTIPHYRSFDRLCFDDTDRHCH